MRSVSLDVVFPGTQHSGPPGRSCQCGATLLQSVITRRNAVSPRSTPFSIGSCVSLDSTINSVPHNPIANSGDAASGE